MMMIPTLETNRLILKDISLGDAPSYERHFVDYNVVRYLSDRVPWPYPKDGIKMFIRDQILPTQGKNRWFWGLYLKSNPGELIGGIELWRPGSPENRGFWLGTTFWGQGLMTEAVVAVNDFAFTILKFPELILSNAVTNKASSKIKEKTGARLIRTETAKFVDPNLTEREIWQLTSDAWTLFRSRC